MSEGSSSRIAALVVPLLIGLMLLGVAVAASRIDADGNRWPSRQFGEAGREALIPPVMDVEYRLSTEPVAGIVRTEFPPGSGMTYEHPTVIARYVHALYETHVRGEASPAQIDSLRRHAAYLAATAESRTHESVDFVTWSMPMPLPEFHVGPGWSSAFANAAAALALEQAAHFAPEQADRYRSLAESAVLSLSVPVDAGGVATDHGDGRCFEEVAAPASPTCILNGHLFVMGYLYALAGGSDQEVRSLLSDGEDYVRAHLDAYVSPFASRYHPTGKYAEPDGYNRIHGDQLLWLFSVTADRTYYDMASMWTQFDGAGLADTVTVSRSIDPVQHGPRRLTDGPAWYGYWSGAGATSIEIAISPDVPVCGFNVFWVEDRRPDRLEALLDGAAVPFHEVASDEAGAASVRTDVGAYRFETCRAASTVTIVSEGGSEVTAIRELDVVGVTDMLVRQRIPVVLEGPLSYTQIIALRGIGR